MRPVGPAPTISTSVSTVLVSKGALRRPQHSPATAKKSPGRGLVSVEPQAKMPPDVGPFAGQHAIHHAVANRAVAPGMVMANDAVLLRTQRFDRSLRSEVEVVGAQPHDLASERLKGVLEQQELAHRVDVRSLPSAGIPRVSDLDAIDISDDVVITRAAHKGALLQLAYRPGQHVP